MKGNILVFDFMIFCCAAAYGSEVIVSGPEQLVSVGVGSDVIINNGGTYSLNNLDSINANTITFDFDMAGGGANPLLVLNVDSGFDGILNTPLINNIDNLQIKLMDGFLTGVDGNKILNFTDFTNNGGFINVFSENTSDTYSYSWGVCSDGTGWCITRNDSVTYTVARQSVLHAEQVASIGVQNNPKMLLRPMTVVNQHELLDVYNFSDEFFISLSPEYYNAKDFHNLGMRLNSGAKIGGRLSVGLAAYAVKADFKNDVSDFRSDVYGGNLRFNYELTEILFLRGVGGFSISNIDCSDVITGNDVTDNPSAYSMYGGLDVGTIFKFDSGLYVSPFVGYDASSDKIVDIKQNDSFLRAGSDIGFKYFMDGVSYDYILRAGLNTHGKFDAMVGIGIGSVSDKIDGSVSFGVIDTDFGLSGKVAANVKFAF